MAYEVLRFKLVGVAPLLMHNVRLADPLNKFAKAMKVITAKRGKTDDDHEKLSNLEWFGGMYVDEDHRPCLPGEILEAGLVSAAKKFKQGQQFRTGVMSNGEWPIRHDGPAGIDDLWNDPRFRDTRAVRVGQARVMRTRPIFKVWSVECEVMYLPGIVNPDRVKQAMEVLGGLGLMDFRPRFGRFEVADG